MNRQCRVIAVSFFTAILSGCPMEHFPSCRGDEVFYPGGKCSAYYYQTDYNSGGETTQAMVDCTINGQRLGGNVVAFHNLKTGIGLRWIDAKTLEVAVPTGVALNDQRTSNTYLGHQLQYRYRNLQPNEPAALGCDPK
jgi:hypothetical protein